MILRLLNLAVIACLVGAAVYVYDIKYDTTRRAQRVAQLRIELRHEREAVAALRARWARLDSPARLEALSGRHMAALKPVQTFQFGGLERVPERAQPIADSGIDPIAALLEGSAPTGSIPAPRKPVASAVLAPPAPQR